MLEVLPTGCRDACVRDLPDLLNPGDVMVVNDTRVIPARLSGVRRRDGAQGLTEARIEATLLGPRADGTWGALIKPLKKLRIGEDVVFGAGLSARLEAVADGTLSFAEMQHYIARQFLLLHGHAPEPAATRKEAP